MKEDTLLQFLPYWVVLHMPAQGGVGFYCLTSPNCKHQNKIDTTLI